MKYTVDFFIQKFQNIPEHKWCSGSSTFLGNKKCAYEHCGARLNDIQPEECIALSNIFESFLGREFDNGYHDYFGLSWSVVYVNDKGDKRYQQSTPQKRILAVLYDIKANEAVNEANKIISEPQEVLCQ